MFQFYGIAAAQNRDNTGEILEIAGVDTRNLKRVIDEHSAFGNKNPQDNRGFWSIIGSVDKSKKIFKIEDCESQRERRCFRVAKGPFVYVEGHIAPGHPNGEAAIAIARDVLANPDDGMTLGLSIEGGVYERGSTDQADPAYKIIKESVAHGVAWTVNPANPRCLLFVDNDLQKSMPGVRSEAYQSFRHSHGHIPSFVERPELVLRAVQETLEKSRALLMKNTGKITCWNCGHQQWFRRSWGDVPHRCESCGLAHGMSEMYKSMKEES